MWYDKIDRIVCLNLAIREDRLLQFTEQADIYGIPFERIEAIYDAEQGARGLRDTMVRLFEEEVAKGTRHLLIFEDDCLNVADPVTFANTMNGVMEQIPEDYHIVLLGCQLSHQISHFRSANLFPVTMAYSTHAAMYSFQGMREILGAQMQYPIDNWMTEKIQPIGRTYCVYPLLCSQVPGHSDIGKNFISWRPFIEARYEQKINEFRCK